MRGKISFVLTLVLVLAMVPVQSFASESWAQEALTSAIENGILYYNDGEIAPEKILTRAEIAVMMNRVLGTTDKGSLSNYTDIDVNDWYYEDMSKAVASNLYEGYDNQLRPNDSVTREEMFNIISRSLDIFSDEAVDYTDYDLTSEWAKSSIAGLTQQGYLKGYPDGTVNPKGNITKAEFVQVLHNIFNVYVNEPGIYEHVGSGNVVVNAPGVTLKGVNIAGDLVIGDGVGKEEVTLEDVTIAGRLIVRGGGEESIIIKGNSTIRNIIILKINGKVRVFNETGKEIETTYVKGNDDVILEGNFGDVEIGSDDIAVFAKNANIEIAVIKGERSEFIVDDKSEIDKVEVGAKNVTIEGKGKITEVTVTKDGSGTKITTPNTEIDVDSGAADVEGTGGVVIKSNEIYINGRTDSQDAKPLNVEPSRGSSGGSSGNTDNTDNTVTTYKVNYSVVGENGTLVSSISTGSSVNSGASVTFTATPSTGYEVKEWKVNGVVVSGGSTLTRTVSSNTTVTVEFKLIPESEMFIVIYNVVGENGTISSSLNSGIGALPNTEVTFTATPDAGYEVKEWKVNDVVVEAENTLTTTITAYTRVTVEFREIVVTPNNYTITIDDKLVGGSISGDVDSGATVEEGTELEFVATPIEGYKFTGWVVTGTNAQSIGNTVIITVNSDITVSGTFEEITELKHTLNITVDPSDSTVTVINPLNNEMTGTFTEWNSQWTYNLPEGMYDIKVEKEGYITKEYTQNMIGPSNHMITLEEADTTPPELVSISPAPGSEIWVEDGGTFTVSITGYDENLHKIHFNPNYDAYLYAMEDVYNGDTELEEMFVEGFEASYNNGTWDLIVNNDFGEMFLMFVDLEDSSGNRLSDRLEYTSEEDLLFSYTIRTLDKTELNDLKTVATEIVPNDYSIDTWNDFEVAMMMPESTGPEVAAKYDALLLAWQNLYELVSATEDTYTVESNSVSNNFLVMSNDKGTGAGVVGTSQPSFGTLDVFPYRIEYTPNEGFVGEDTFVYALADSYAMEEATVTVSVEPTGEYMVSGYDSHGNEYGFYTDTDGVKVIIEGTNSEELYFSDSVESFEVTDGELDVMINYYVGDDVYAKIIGIQNINGITKPKIMDEWYYTPLQSLIIEDVNEIGLNKIEVGKTYILSHNKVPLDTTDVVIQEWGIVSGDATINSTGEFVANSAGEIVVRVYNMNTEIGNFSDEITLTAYNIFTVSSEIVGTPYGTLQMSIQGENLTNHSLVREGSIVRFEFMPSEPNIEVVEWYRNGFTDLYTGTAQEIEIVEDMVVGIKLEKQNSPPVANDDYVDVEFNGSVLVDIMLNDEDIDGDTLYIAGFSQASNGVVSPEGDSLRYTPHLGFTGVEEFMYEIYDGNGGVDTAIVTVTVINW